jgi:hypothetical protein
MSTGSTEAAKVNQVEEEVPDYLIKETIDGIPFYRKGYKAVLRGEKSLEDIMGSSGLQFVILQYFLRLIVRHDPEERYYIGNNEAGLHLERGKNMANDLALYDERKLTPDKISKKYVDVAPDIVIEVDTDFEVKDISSMDAIFLKTQRLLDFGTQKVIWVFTSSRKVLIAQAAQTWLTFDWHEDIELFENATFNVGAYLDKKGIQVD